MIHIMIVHKMISLHVSLETIIFAIMLQLLFTNAWDETKFHQQYEIERNILMRVLMHMIYHCKLYKVQTLF